MSDPRDELAVFRANVDQVTSTMREVAAPVASFYTALVGFGVPPENAATIASTFLLRIMSPVDDGADR